MCEHTTDDTMIGTNTTRHCQFVCLMVFNATFNNISVINKLSCRQVLLVGETRGPRENHRPVANH